MPPAVTFVTRCTKSARKRPVTVVDASVISANTVPKPRAATRVSRMACRCTGAPLSCGPPARTTPVTATAMPATCVRPGRSPRKRPTPTGTATLSVASGETTPIGPSARAL
jgi:hypothetical protein